MKIEDLLIVKDLWQKAHENSSDTPVWVLLDNQAKIIIVSWTLHGIKSLAARDDLCHKDSDYVVSRATLGVVCDVVWRNYDLRHTDKLFAYADMHIGGRACATARLCLWQWRDRVLPDLMWSIACRCQCGSTSLDPYRFARHDLKSDFCITNKVILFL